MNPVCGVVAVRLRRCLSSFNVTVSYDQTIKPVRLTVLIGVTAIIVCGFAVFYTHRSAHGTTAEERAARGNAADGSGVEPDCSKVLRAAGPG